MLAAYRISHLFRLLDMSDAVFNVTGVAGLADLPCYELHFGQARVVVSPYGAHVLSYQPTPGQELLWLSPKAVWQQLDRSG